MNFKSFNGKPITLKRFLFMLIGIVFTNFNVGLIRVGGFGIDPFQTFNVGMGDISPLSFGTTELIVCAVLLVIDFILDKSLLFVGTLIIVVFSGYLVDAGSIFFNMVLPNPSLPVRILCLIAGIAVMSVMSSFYYVADMGVSSYDALSMALSRRITKISYKAWRITTDILCVVFGVILHLAAGYPISELLSFIGIGTLILAGFTGPLFDFCVKNVASPLLYGKNSNSKTTGNPSPESC